MRDRSIMRKLSSTELVLSLHESETGGVHYVPSTTERIDSTSIKWSGYRSGHCLDRVFVTSVVVGRMEFVETEAPSSLIPSDLLSGTRVTPYCPLLVKFANRASGLVRISLVVLSTSVDESDDDSFDPSRPRRTTDPTIATLPPPAPRSSYYYGEGRGAPPSTTPRTSPIPPSSGSQRYPGVSYKKW